MATNVRATVESRLEYVSDKQGHLKGVIVPIGLWRDIASELETTHLLKSKAMRQRLLMAKRRKKGIPLGEALEKLGI